MFPRKYEYARHQARILKLKCCDTEASATVIVMPLDRSTVLQLGLLLLAVPAQFLITHYFMPSNPESRSQALKSVISKALVFQNDYLSWHSWHRWCMSLLSQLRTEDGLVTQYAEDDDPEGESPAIEVLNYRDPKGYFATSPHPRSPRLPSVRFRVGQVIRHKRWGYRGVIVGWDPTAKAPERWIQEMHRGKPSYKSQPNYAILVDTRDRVEAQSTYVPEENIEILSNVKILHPDVEHYFEDFDGAQYLIRPWLKKVYPHD